MNICRKRSLSSVGVLLAAMVLAVSARAQVNEDVEVAEDLLVELDASELEIGPGPEFWENLAPETIGDFQILGDPQVVERDGVMAVSFNEEGRSGDSYESIEEAPFGILGPDPSRSIEIWVWNEQIATEETLIAWGKRGGPDGSNMSFNYGSHNLYGAVGHWGGNGPDLGWNDGGGSPEAGEWHHLVYTYDGEITRVYTDGCIDTAVCNMSNEEFLGFGRINTHPGKIRVAQQTEGDGFGLTLGLQGSLAVARLRIHDGVLDGEQILANYEAECDEFCPQPSLCICENCPEEEQTILRGRGIYRKALTFGGRPAPTSLEIVEPEGATIDAQGQIEYNLPDPEPDSFMVTVRCTNAEGEEDFSWLVILEDPPDRNDDIIAAGEIFVDLDAGDPSAGEDIWVNAGTAGDFILNGVVDAIVLGPVDSPAVMLNPNGLQGIYQAEQNAPAGLVGIDPTRSVEVWAYNEFVDAEETMIAWGRRGGPDGSEMSFNFGNHGNFGAVTHWGGGGPDLGWMDNAFTPGSPTEGEWHHLVYTFDGDDTATTRLYVDGEAWNSEVNGLGAINTHPDHPITLGSQIVNAGGAIDWGPRVGTLALGQVRVHDEVLTHNEILHNFNAERERYGVEGAPEEAPRFLNVPEEGRYFSGRETYVFRLEVEALPPAELEVISPEGGTIDSEGRFEYVIPDPEPDSFEVEIVAVNSVGETVASWAVVREVVEAGDIEVAEELLVSLDARDPTAGEEFWENHGTMDDFQIVGTPVVEQRDFGIGVSFNENGRSGDSYESMENAPEGVVGPDPTRSIEIWVWPSTDNPNEETLVGWGKRGGPDGSNMGFLYGNNAAHGAVGHWGSPDLGYNDGGGVPASGEWHHLVYTYDGETTRVYSDNCLVASECDLSNEEFLGFGRINTHMGTKIRIAQQTEGDGVGMTLGLQGRILVAKLRIHDGVLSPEQIEHNYETELSEFSAGPCPQEGEPGYADTHLVEVSVLRTGFGLGASHRATAVGEDESGDPVLYTFKVEPQIEGVAERVTGPQISGTANLWMRTPGAYRLTVTVQDREDCDDFAEDAISRSVIIVGDEIPPEECGNGWDDDGDGDTDCDDADCAGTPDCDAVPMELCDNGQDDDGDGMVDCADSDCPACPELCDNGVDDDGDGAADCDDDDCAEAAACKVPAGPLFVRGDGNSDGSINLTDGVIPLLYLFSGGDAPLCFDAADTNDTGIIEITDAIIIFSWLFSGGAPPASPTPSSAGYLQEDCGVDETEDGSGCLRVSPICN